MFRHTHIHFMCRWCTYYLQSPFIIVECKSPPLTHTHTHTHTHHTHTHTHTHTHSFYSMQKKTMEINPRHPLIKELQRRVSEDETDETTSDLARVLYETALLRSGYVLQDSGDFAGRIERMMRLSLGVDLAAPVSLGRV